jgi:hypothetical protein
MFDLLLPVVIVLRVSKRKTRMPIQVFCTALQLSMQHCDQSVNAVFENNRCLRKRLGHDTFLLGNKLLAFRRV